MAQIDFSNTNLQKFPDTALNSKNYESCDVIFLNNNQLQSLPGDIGNFRLLKKLFLSKNALTDLPWQLAGADRIFQLNVNHNELSAFPDVISKFAYLELLRLDHNNITSFPADLSRMKKLRHIELSQNMITHIPASFAALINLTELRVDENPVSSVTADLFRLPRLKRLFMHGKEICFNHFADPKKREKEFRSVMGGKVHIFPAIGQKAQSDESKADLLLNPMHKSWYELGFETYTDYINYYRAKDMSLPCFAKQVSYPGQDTLIPDTNAADQRFFLSHLQASYEPEIGLGHIVTLLVNLKDPTHPLWQGSQRKAYKRKEKALFHALWTFIHDLCRCYPEFVDAEIPLHQLKATQDRVNDAAKILAVIYDEFGPSAIDQYIAHMPEKDQYSILDQYTDILPLAVEAVKTRTIWAASKTDIGEDQYYHLLCVKNETELAQKMKQRDITFTALKDLAFKTYSKKTARDYWNNLRKDKIYQQDFEYFKQEFEQILTPQNGAAKLLIELEKKSVNKRHKWNITFDRECNFTRNQWALSDALKAVVKSISDRVALMTQHYAHLKMKDYLEMQESFNSCHTALQPIYLGQGEQALLDHVVKIMSDQADPLYGRFSHDVLSLVQRELIGDRLLTNNKKKKLKRKTKGLLNKFNP